MQKVRLQIMLTGVELNKIHSFLLENNLKNESEAIGMMIQMNSRYQKVISELEKKAHEAEGWKKKAENPGGMSGKNTIVADVKKSTDSKQKSAENIKDSVKPGGKN